MLKKPKGKTVTVWGLAFKPNTDDMREAPSVDIIKALQKQGIKIKAYDPVAQKNAKIYFKNVKYFDNLEKSLEKSDLLLTLTDWDEFKKFDIKKIKNKLKSPLIFDARNIYSPEKMAQNNLTYRSIGR